MKKIFFLFSTLCCLYTAANAQFIQTGFRGGLHFNQMNALGWQSNNQTSPFGGVYVNIGKNKLALQLEGFYTTQTVTTDSSFKGLYNQYYNILVDSSKIASLKFNKIQVPVLFTFRFNKKFWIQFGGVFSNDISVINKANFKETATNIIKSKDVSLSGGFWLGITKRLSASARYTQSLNDLNNLESYSTTFPLIDLKKWHNQQIQLGIGIKVF
jgi:hypothetical protein